MVRREVHFAIFHKLKHIYYFKIYSVNGLSLFHAENVVKVLEHKHTCKNYDRFIKHF